MCMCMCMCMCICMCMLTEISIHIQQRLESAIKQWRAVLSTRHALAACICMCMYICAYFPDFLSL